jgi:endonuclease YncB( thermonuclease family)
MRKLAMILLLLGLAGPAAAQSKGQMFGGAPAAFDGDTLRVEPEGAPSVRVRLWGIETSEMADAHWGRQAHAALAEFLDYSRRVQCRVVDHDAHKLAIARCVTTGPGVAGGKDLAIWLLERGWAVADRDVTQAAGADPWLAQLYDMAEGAARESQRGRWGETPK